MVFVTGSALERLKAALLDVARREEPKIPPLPEAFRHFRRELGMEVYGVGMRIAHDDKTGQAAAVLCNYEFFGAPLAAIVCMHSDLSHADSLSVGMYLQTLLLALTERGLGTCLEVSVAGYPEILRKELDLEPELSILCGLAIGYSDPDFSANLLHVGREDVNKNVVFKSD